ncbi:MAG: WD40/YVTN/BNR-like repeat-containing protein [Gemmatimonadales bacterium]
MSRRLWATIALLLLGITPSLSAQAPRGITLDSTLLAGFRWRPIGPANMAGRITDVEGIPGTATFYFAAAAGGIWKTTNNGTTFRPVFDHERCIAMGDLAIAPSDTSQIWAGTGEEDSRNSISPGCGIFKSTDGGTTWTHMGLERSGAIGRIVVHPTNPDIVYVAALGQIWAANPERGLYKTTDGGKSWQLVKFISEHAGFVDIAMDPTNPDVLWAASWERVRGPYFLRSGGPGSALWKSTDAGRAWTQVKGGGLPETTLGRIGIAIAQSDPKVMYLMVEADTTPNPRPTPGRAAQPRPSGLYRSADGGATWERTSDDNVRPFYYSQVRVDPKDPNRVYWSSTPVHYSNDGGKTVGNATVGIHVDHHAMWIDPTNPNHFIVGNDGGIAITWDRGGSYDFPNILPLGQFYNISYGMEFPYTVCGGLQDNGSWCGPSRRREDDITNADWVNVGGGDGFYTAQHPTEPWLIYSESQGGNIGRFDFRTGDRDGLQRPDFRPRYQMFEDSIVIERPDTTRPETAAQRRRIAELRARQHADSAEMALRWNWNTPFFISAHNPDVLYAGANKVMKSTARGENLYPISPDLSTRDTMKIRISLRGTGGVTPDLTGAETHCTIVSLAESPIRPGILIAGTDDGNVWLTKNDGGDWENLTGRFPGVPRYTYVSRIEPSHFDTATFYVTFDGHRSNDFTPYVYVTTDFGRSFRSIASTLPRGGPDFVHVIREDPTNRDLLLVGTELGVYVSLNRGASWQRFMTNLPTVPVHDLKIHPRDHEVIAGTHGRSIWIVDIAPLQQLSDRVLAADAWLFQPKIAYQYGQAPVGGGSPGHKVFRADSPPYGAEIVYRLADGSDDRRARTRIAILDVLGDTIHTVEGPARAGVHRVVWDFEGREPAPIALSPSEKRDSAWLARRIEVVFDSLIEAGGKERMLTGIKEGLLAGDLEGLARRFGFGGRGGGGGQRTVRAGAPFVERPGETPLRENAGADNDSTPDPGFARELAARLRRPGQSGGGFGGLGFVARTFRGQTGGGRFGGGDEDVVTTGDYLISMRVNGKTLTRVLRVERGEQARPR